MAFQPISDISKVHVIHAEDASYTLQELGAGLTWLLGIDDRNYHPFSQIDHAAEFLENIHGRDLLTILFLDNQTPPSELEGIELATNLLNRKDEFPNLIIVTVTSSDVSLALDEGGRQTLDNLRAAGGEFWSKHQESRLCLLWLADCLRTGEIIPRETWLTKYGIETRYKLNIGNTKGHEEIAIMGITASLLEPETFGEPSDVLLQNGLERGDFFRLSTAEVLAKLGFPNRGVEGTPPHTKETL